MRPVFVGNLDYDTRHSELDRLFYRYGRIERIDMKSGPHAPHPHLRTFPAFDFDFRSIWYDAPGVNPDWPQIVAWCVSSHVYRHED
uniref:SRP2C n=1 Tax=Arundo donax TaxID=35708 RepID=A0A0A9EXS0_ARUDO